MSASACLRTFDRDAAEIGLRCLYGQPESLGVTEEADGTRRAGVMLAVTARGAVAFDSPSREWLDAAIAALTQARDELVYGGFRNLQLASATRGE
jgi:hypothetical protein